MHHPTRNAVEALLPPGTTVDDLSDSEVQDLFNSIVQQAKAEAEGTADPDGTVPPG
ncbi:hypothetical protein [Paracoccus sp. (in: a-proteobacteria)]